MKKSINFTIYQLIINDGTFTLDSFKDVKSGLIDAGKHRDGETHEIEITSIKKVAKEIYQNRFITFYFNYGDKFPYSPVVMKSDLKEYNNPRSSDEIELRDQLLAIIDSKDQRIYISDQRKKTLIKNWLEEKLMKPVVIKSIINEDEFITKIKTLNSIYFTVVPNLLSTAQEGSLSENLVQDIYGYDADTAKLQFYYNNKNITQKLVDKIKAVIANKNNFEELVIVGKDDHDFESILNLDEVTNKVLIEIEVDRRSNFFDPENVITSLIERVS